MGPTPTTLTADTGTLTPVDRATTTRAAGTASTTAGPGAPRSPAARPTPPTTTTTRGPPAASPSSGGWRPHGISLRPLFLVTSCESLLRGRFCVLLTIKYF